MKSSEQIDKVAAALSKAQASMRAAPKLKTNPHFKSKYADLPSLWDAAREALTDNGLALLQLPRHVPEGGVCIETMVMHSSGQWISDDGLFVPATKQDAQGYGSALTYARRYGMGAFLGMVSDEDDDGNAASQRREEQRPSAMSAKDLADWLAAVDAAADPVELKGVWESAAKAAKSANDAEAHAKIREAVTARSQFLKAAA